MRLFRKITEAFPEIPYREHYLPDDEYVKKPTGKMNGRFILHCTNGSSMRYLGGKGGIWDNDSQGPVATMFGVEKDGLLYQYFDEDYWAYGTGCGAAYDQNTIQVEIGNRAMVYLINGKFYWNPNGTLAPYEGTPYKSPTPFMGCLYWDPYPEVQVDTVAKLTAYACYNHGIPLELERRIDYHGPNFNQKGVLTHSFLSNQRSDPGPAFPYEKYWELVNKYFLQLCNKHGYPVYGEKPKV